MKSRYFVELAFKGTNFYGWQYQPNQVSVQETIAHAFTTLLREEIAIVGCGRTDTGVHASQYFIHFDTTKDIPNNFLVRVNKFLPKDIVILDLFAVNMEAHARFGAYKRAYEYHIHFVKNPFLQGLSTFIPQPEKVDFDKLQEAANLLMGYDEFYPFCKTNNDAKTMKCKMYRCEWDIDIANNKMVLHIAANRFLRGMVRLTVGMCLNVAMGRLSLEQVQQAMEKQERLPLDLSVAADGLFLSQIHYEMAELKKKEE